MFWAAFVQATIQDKYSLADKNKIQICVSTSSSSAYAIFLVDGHIILLFANSPGGHFSVLTIMNRSCTWLRGPHVHALLVCKWYLSNRLVTFSEPDGNNYAEKIIK